MLATVSDMEEGTGEATAPQDDAPSPLEATASDQAVEESTGEDDGSFSIADALAEARAELDAQPEETASGDSKEPPAKDVAETTETPPAEQATEAPVARKDPAQGELQRILQLVEEGRQGELSPTARGVLRRLQENVKQEAARENEYRETYLRFERMKGEDPEAFADEVINDPAIPRFMRAYKAKHPDVSLDSPNGSTTADPVRIRRELDAEYAEAVTETVAMIAANAGLDEPSIDRIRQESGGKLGVMMARAFEESVKAAVAKELPKIKEAERVAAQQEAQAAYANKTIIAPRVVNGTPGNVKGAGRDPSQPYTWADALAESKQELELV